MADIYIEYLPPIGNNEFDTKARQLVDLLRVYLTAHDTNYLSKIGASTDHAIARWNGTAGSALQDSGVLIDDNNDILLSDSDKVRLGTGQDCDLYHDGTNNLIRLTNGELQIGGATHYTAIEVDGTIEFNGDATVWEDANIGSASLGAGATAPDLVNINSTGIFARGFDGNATVEQLFAEIEIPHSTKANSNITFHVHWMPSSANAGFVKWHLTYILLADGSTVTTANTITVRTAAGGTAWNMKRSDFSAFAVSMGQQLFIRFWRDPTDATANDDDTYPDDAVVATLGFHYESDTLGSRAITTK